VNFEKKIQVIKDKIILNENKFINEELYYRNFFNGRFIIFSKLFEFSKFKIYANEINYFFKIEMLTHFGLDTRKFSILILRKTHRGFEYGNKRMEIGFNVQELNYIKDVFKKTKNESIDWGIETIK